MTDRKKIYDGTLSIPFRMVLSGSSGCGKSFLIHKLMINDNGLYPHQFDNIVYCYGVKTEAMKSLEKHFKEILNFHEGIPGDLIGICSKGEHNLCVLDDLDEESFSSKDIAMAFTRWSHHHNFSIILSTQNMFSNGTKRLTLIRNATHIVLFPNYLDQTVPRLLAQKIFPSNPQEFLKIYNKATSVPRGYLAVFGNGPRELQFRTDITCPVQRIFTVMQ